MPSLWLHDNAMSCLNKVETESVDFIFTSPPYSIVKNGHPEKLYTHPCQTPTELIIKLIRSLCPPEGLIVDPFGGVASTYVSALKTERQCISCEKDLSYFVQGKKRIKNFKKLVFHETKRIQISEIKNILTNIKTEIKLQKKELQRLQLLPLNEDTKTLIHKRMGVYECLILIKDDIEDMFETDQAKIIHQQYFIARER